MAALPTRAAIVVNISSLRNGTADLDGALTAQFIADIVMNDGNGVNQINRQFNDSNLAVPTAGVTIDLQLSTASLPDATLNLANVRVLVCKAAPANTGAITIGPGTGTNPWLGLWSAAATTTLQPGNSAIFILPQLGAVLGASKEIFVDTAEAADQAVHLMILGATA